MSNESIGTGDRVRHISTDKTLIAAYVDGDSLYWVGSPLGCVDVGDVILIEKATPTARRQALRMMILSENQDDPRVQYARAKLI
jgi:hypothetical protein